MKATIDSWSERMISPTLGRDMAQTHGRQADWTMGESLIQPCRVSDELLGL